METSDLILLWFIKNPTGKIVETKITTYTVSSWSGWGNLYIGNDFVCPSSSFGISNLYLKLSIQNTNSATSSITYSYTSSGVVLNAIRPGTITPYNSNYRVTLTWESYLS